MEDKARRVEARVSACSASSIPLQASASLTQLNRHVPRVATDVANPGALSPLAREERNPGVADEERDFALGVVMGIVAVGRC